MSTWIERFQVDAPGGVLRVAVKDLIDLAGVATTNASKVIAATAEPAAADATCLAGTRAAVGNGSAVIAGKTNLHELAFGVTGVNPWFGTPVNPIDPALVPGGSSSGSAVAVADGEAEVAFGSDTGGSIRIPAACCGVVGLKTTRGRIPLDGVLPLAPSLDTIGPMGTTVAATASGMTLLDPGFAPADEPARSVGRVRLPADRWVDDALDAALAAAGFEVVEVELPGWDAATRATMVVLGAEAWHTHAQLWRDHAAELSPDVSERLATSSTISSEDVAAARAQAHRWDAELTEVFARVEVLALPTIPTTPPRLEDAAELARKRYVGPFNVSGTPALSMPVASSGFPASLQLAGPAGSEALLVATAAAVESAAGWRGGRGGA